MLAAAVRGGSLALLGRKALVVEVARISLPDDLDTQAIQVRHGNVLQPSQWGLR